MSQPRTEPTYGHWRKPSSGGLGSLGLAGTVLLLIGLVVVVVLLSVDRIAALVTAAVVVAVLVPLSLRVDGRSALQRLTARAAWWAGRSRRAHLYRSGIGSPVLGGQHRLPGLAAQTRVYACVDAYEQPFAMVFVPSSQHCSVTLRAGADGAALVDADQVDTWVAGWGQFLAALGHEPGLEACAVTVETAPDPGVRLEQAVAGNRSPAAPALSRQVMDQIVATYPAGSAVISTRIQLTWRMTTPAGRRTPQDMAVELGARLPGLTATLATTGAGAVSAMTVEQIAETVRVAYDPAAFAAIERARAEHGHAGITWTDAGPVAAQEHWDTYQHDSGTTTTWTMSEAPRGTVTSRVLLALLRPHRDIDRKRVTLVYRPHDAGSAARIVERDVRNARFKASHRAAGPLARDDLAYRAAMQTAAEEARGAGLSRVSMLVSATVTDPARAHQARTVVEASLAASSRLRLRRAYGFQASAFASTLPVGVVLPLHVRIPATLREAAA